MNFIPFDSDKVCMGWTWYLGDDMIFFIVGIAIIPIFHRAKLLGWFLLLSLTGISLGVTAFLITKYHLSAYIFDQHYAEILGSIGETREGSWATAACDCQAKAVAYRHSLGAVVFGAAELAPSVSTRGNPESNAPAFCTKLA